MCTCVCMCVCGERESESDRMTEREGGLWGGEGEWIAPPSEGGPAAGASRPRPPSSPLFPRPPPSPPPRPFAFERPSAARQIIIIPCRACEDGTALAPAAERWARAAESAGHAGGEGFRRPRERERERRGGGRERGREKASESERQEHAGGEGFQAPSRALARTLSRPKRVRGAGRERGERPSPPISCLMLQLQINLQI